MLDGIDLPAFALKCAGRALLLLVALSFFIFGCAHLAPGGVCSLEPIESHAQCVGDLGLNQSLPQQYGHWLAATLKGTIGQSATGPGLWSTILGGLPATIVLVLTSYFLMAVVSWIRILFPRFVQVMRRPFRLLGFLAPAIPTFWLGLVLLYILAFSWQALPEGQVDTPNIHALWSQAWFTQLHDSPRIVLINLIKHLILPTVTLATFLSLFDDFGTGRVTPLISNAIGARSSLSKVRSQGGLFTPVFKLALPESFRSAWKLLAALVTGLVVVETIFRFSGMGQLFSSALATKDFATAVTLIGLGGMTLIFARLVGRLGRRWALGADVQRG